MGDRLSAHIKSLQVRALFCVFGSCVIVSLIGLFLLLNFLSWCSLDGMTSTFDLGCRLGCAETGVGRQ